MRVSDWILARLAKEGITHAFTVYGGAISELMDAFTRQRDINYVVTIHEQAAGFAAEGYAKARGIPGLAIATSGPGGGNMVTAMQNCYYDSTPCIFLTGQVATPLINREPTVRQLGFQETPICDIVRRITKYAGQPQSAEDARQMLETALMEAKSGRPGPVLLDIPIDVQREECSAMPFFPWSRNTSWPRDLFMSYALDLAKAKRPAILVGGGARGASMAIVDFACKHAIPCFRTWNAFDVITDDERNYCGTIGTYGGPGRNFGIQNCDLLLSLGCRMSGRITGGRPETFARGAKKYIVDIDLAATTAGTQPVKGDVNVLASCADFMFAQYPVAAHFQDWFDQCRRWLHQYDPVKPEMFEIERDEDLHHYGFMRRLSELLPANSIIVSDTGGNQIMMGHCFQSKRGQRIFSSNGNTPMGFALCGAIGAWFAEPARPVVCIIGDGGMQMNIQELQTMVHYGVKVKVFVINNGVLGNTKSYQRVNHMKEVACGPDGYSAPDFTKIAVAYGIYAYHIPGWKYVDTIIMEMLAHDGPAICDVPDPDRCQYEPRISRWDVGIEDAYPYLPRDEFRANMLIEPLPGWENIK